MSISRREPYGELTNERWCRPKCMETYRRRANRCLSIPPEKGDLSTASVRKMRAFVTRRAADLVLHPWGWHNRKGLTAHLYLISNFAGFQGSAGTPGPILLHCLKSSWLERRVSAWDARRRRSLPSGFVPVPENTAFCTAVLPEDRNDNPDLPRPIGPDGQS